MSYSLQDTSDLTALGNAIRAKNGSSDTYTVAQMATAVSNISTGGGSSEAIDFIKAVIEDSSALQNYTSIPSGIFDSSMWKISNYFFNSKTNLRLTSLPSTIKEIGSYAFQSSGLRTFALPSSLMTIEVSAFASCSDLTLSSFSQEIAHIQNYAFQNCPNIVINHIHLKQMQVGGSTGIGGSAFRYCSGITNLTIDYEGTNNAIQISSSAFRDCSGLTTVYLLLPTSNLTMQGGIFTNCSALTDIYVSWSSGAVAGAPWGATNATIHYDWVPPTT